MKTEIALQFGDVRLKTIRTANHFVSHMIEHIAWRMGVSIDLFFEGENWGELGRELGAEIAKFPAKARSAAALGMIDDGSAVVKIESGDTGVEFFARSEVDLEFFLDARCEQLANGRPLVELLRGLSEGMNARVSIEVWTLEDPHHTWEGIFRGVGIALGKIFEPASARDEGRASFDRIPACRNDSSGPAITVANVGMHSATVERATAETTISATISFRSGEADPIRITAHSSIEPVVAKVPELLGLLTEQAGFSLRLDFRATTLSSSHVVMEDIGLVVGRALLEILKLRMDQVGVNGAGSSVRIPSDTEASVHAGISIEGRKFLRLVPERGDSAEFRRGMIIGGDVLGSLRSEDVDDLLDGLTGGMCASLVVLIRDYSDPNRAWCALFRALGLAIAEAFDANPYRRGVPPGVKATLA